MLLQLLYLLLELRVSPKLLQVYAPRWRDELPLKPCESEALPHREADAESDLLSSPDGETETEMVENTAVGEGAE